MEAAHALAELLSASPQVEAATVFGRGDEPIGAVGVSHERASAAARASLALLDGAGGLRGIGEATQVHASLAGHDVFLVRTHDGPAILAVTEGRQPAGLLFHELKRCLASLKEEQE